MKIEDIFRAFWSYKQNLTNELAFRKRNKNLLLFWKKRWNSETNECYFFQKGAESKKGNYWLNWRESSTVITWRSTLQGANDKKYLLFAPPTRYQSWSQKLIILLFGLINITNNLASTKVQIGHFCQIFRLRFFLRKYFYKIHKRFISKNFYLQLFWCLTSPRHFVYRIAKS